MKDPLQELSLTERVKKHLKLARQHTREWRSETKESFGFVDGTEQWSDDERQVLRDQLRPEITFNRTGPVVDVVCGEELNNRQEVTFIPREEGDAKANELYTAAAEWCRDQCDAEDEESDAFRDMIICGMGWTETRMDYDTDLEGMVSIERVDPLEMYWDPAAKKQNLADARWVARVKEFDKEELRDMFPVTADQVIGPLGLWEGEQDDDTPHITLPGDQYDGEGGDSTYKDEDKVEVVEYQWFEQEDVYRIAIPDAVRQQLAGIVDLNANEIVSPKLHAKIKEKVEEAGFKLKSTKQKRRVYKRVFIAGDKELDRETGPCSHSFTFKAMTGKRDRNKRVWYGLVRSMKDPQRWANKWLSQVMHIINSNAKGGLLAEEGAFVNPRKAEEDWADPSSITLLKNGALSSGKVKEKSPITFPAGLDKLMEFAVSSIRDVSGVNVEMLGMREGNQPGILEYQRKQAGMAILGGMFNSLRRYRKEQGRLLLYFIDEYITDGRLIRIVGEGRAQYVPLTKQEGVKRYDVVVDDTPNSPNQKDRVFSILSGLVPQLMSAGIPVPPEVLDYAPLPDKLIEKWKETVQSAQGPSPEEIQQMQLSLQLLQDENQKLKSDKSDKIAEIQSKEKIKAAEIARDAKLAEDKLDLDMRKAEAELALKQREQDMDAEHEARMLALKERELALKEREADVAARLDAAKLGMEAEEREFQRQTPQVVVMPGGKRRVEIERGESGEILGANVVDEE